MKLMLYRNVAFSFIVILSINSSVRSGNIVLPVKRGTKADIIILEDKISESDEDEIEDFEVKKNQFIGITDDISILNEKIDNDFNIFKIEQIDNDLNELKQIDNEEKEPNINFKVGEKLIYNARLINRKKFLGLNSGYVTFEVTKGVLNEKDCYIFKGKVEGSGLGYVLKVGSESYIDSKTLHPLLATNTQSGSEERKKKITFFDDRIEYAKVKHCKLGGKCKNPAHFEEKNNVKMHCKKCEDKKHYTWRIRAVHENNKPTYDLLSGLFVARNFDLKVGGKSKEVVLIEDRDLWKMKVRAIGEETIETEIGKFKTLSLKLTTLPLNEHAKRQETFRGLFGLKGDIGLWVEKKSKIPIRIRGSYPIIFDVPIEVTIKSIEGVDIDTVGN